MIRAGISDLLFEGWERGAVAGGISYQCEVIRRASVEDLRPWRTNHADRNTGCA